MFLLTWLREYREIESSASGEIKHITVVEEAHNVLENVNSKKARQKVAQQIPATKQFKPSAICWLKFVHLVKG